MNTGYLPSIRQQLEDYAEAAARLDALGTEVRVDYELARRLGMSVGKVKELVHAGVLQASKVGRSGGLSVSRDAVNAYLADREA